MDQALLSGKNSRTGLTVAGVVAIVFGLATVASGGRVLFAGGRPAAGNVVDFVLWFNFLAGFAYVATGAGLLAGRAWAAFLSALIAFATVAIFVAFGVHVLQGGPFEMRTMGAMVLRSAVWIVIAIMAWRRLR
jgi:hypothetical protein